MKRLILAPMLLLLFMTVVLFWGPQAEQSGSPKKNEWQGPVLEVSEMKTNESVKEAAQKPAKAKVVIKKVESTKEVLLGVEQSKDEVVKTDAEVVELPKPGKYLKSYTKIKRGLKFSFGPSTQPDWGKAWRTSSYLVSVRFSK